MPLQVKRLLIVFAILIGTMFALKYFLTPESWREFGPYRGNALKEIAAQEAKYIDTKTCAMCHDLIAELKNNGEHNSIQCENCHGPGYKHIDDQENNEMKIPKGREFCIRCHARNAARPLNIIKQIDATEHNIGEDCITCHNPHQPWL
ncbi:MAG: hypothetical protein PF484_07820 [Bacteroidales bacterium]|jgi:hypothetical protein|nr:hypothetical protein [Bacteroidales bacterium]